MKNKSIYELLEEEIVKADISPDEKNKQLSRLLKARGQKINLMLVGATGSGKSSTINSIFNTKMAKVGIGADPETKDIECYQLENLTIWDTPGIGDNAENDAVYSKQIVKKLSEVDANGVPVIDLIMIVIDGSTRDLSSTYEMINNIIIPSVTKENSHRILVAVNQADLAMKGQHWDKENNCPDDVLKDFLKEKCRSVEKRIFDATGLELKTMYYCAGCTDENGVQNKPYNLTKLLYNIVLSLPAEKRIAIAENLNDDEDMWEFDDNEEDYIEEISKSFGEIVWNTTEEFAEKGFMAGGMALGVPGAVVAGLVCGFVGAVIGVFKGVFN
ncbi:MAG: 50S ribosome-binding GTPase [Clostridiales bacterium]|nr:50S ribosome-binding GTPase [Clostridiales bacterium]